MHLCNALQSLRGVDKCACPGFFMSPLLVTIKVFAKLQQISELDTIHLQSNDETKKNLIF